MPFVVTPNGVARIFVAADSIAIVIFSDGRNTLVMNVVVFLSRRYLSSMRTRAWCALLVLVVGCGEVQMVAFNAANHTIELCGNRFTEREDFQSDAEYECGKRKPHLVGCGQEDNGFVASRWGDDVVVSKRRRYCCEFRCSSGAEWGY